MFRGNERQRRAAWSTAQLAAASFACLAIAGCAPRADSIEPTYIPPVKYQHFTCDQLSARLDVVQRKLTALVPIQDSAATLDAVAVPAGLAMLWFPPLAIPALFISGGAHKEDLSLLKGEVVAIDASAREKPCPQIVQYIEVNRLAGEAAATNVSR